MDQLGAMRVFVRVVQSGSFSAAARELLTSQASVSKRVATLEAELGVKLLRRTSRDHALTPEGADYYHHCVNWLAELDEVEGRIRAQGVQPKGNLRITAPYPFARQILAPVMTEFLERYPDIQLDFLVSDRRSDLQAEGIDIAIRAGHLEDSSLIVRHLFDNPMLLVASPDYLSRQGVPETPDALSQHQCIVYSPVRAVHSWRFQYQGNTIVVPVRGPFQSDSGDMNLEAAIAGMGITELPVWMVEQALSDGRLVQVLASYQADNVPFNALYPQSRHVPLKVRCFIDFLKEKLAQHPHISPYSG
ncbi:LysR family transcriptional regulator [Ferrimonas balearica]|uniref:LysR family transcriptional regulator n=1 Tax=Ferrimonas balearica TaxID=44012 RepID=UPI001F38E8E9|nr:LysR family transcriptional regulator [Ferrimonas balearica]MBY6019663.1 LysR family transcriptional regulator [Halomonas denitrificans]MBY6096729.1 LysR family transcriptional regulator [Ferrimonas balearica]